MPMSIALERCLFGFSLKVKTRIFLTILNGFHPFGKNKFYEKASVAISI